MLKFPLPLVLFLSLFLLLACEAADKPSAANKTDNAVVLLSFKAQADKGKETVDELMGLIEKVRQEPHFVSIKLHVDPEDNTNIMLYEEWDDLAYYTSEHMRTDYMQEFQLNSRNFLTGPPAITFWEVEKVFN